MKNGEFLPDIKADVWARIKEARPPDFFFGGDCWLVTGPARLAADDSGRKVNISMGEVGNVEGVDEMGGFSETAMRLSWSVVWPTNSGRTTPRNGEEAESCKMELVLDGMITECDDHIASFLLGS